MQISENQMHLCHSDANVPIAAASPANQLAPCWGLDITGEGWGAGEAAREKEGNVKSPELEDLGYLSQAVKVNISHGNVLLEW